MNLEQIKNLSDKEREYLFKILGEVSQSGNSETLEDLKYQDYQEVPVDIETFLYDKNYLGNGLINAEGKFTVFPYWVETLKKIFPNNLDTAYNTLVLTGGIGLGKSFMAVLCIAYLLHRMLCLKDPYLHYGLQPIDKITFSFINVTIDAAKGVGWDKIQQLFQSSPWFMSHGKVSGRSEIIWTPDKRIELVVGSSNNVIIGRALFCLDGDTIIKTIDGDKKIKDLVDKQVRVISLDKDGNEVVSDLCTVKPTICTDEEYQIELEDGTTIKCTSNHKFMLKDGTYKMAKDLTEKDELFDTDISYAEFIQRIIDTRGQWNIPDGEYFEVHHIIPKCMGGSGDCRLCRRSQHHPNLIFLYAREHFIAHKLLALENPNNKSLVLAWSMMAFPSGDGSRAKRQYEITSEEYEQLKQLQSSVMRQNNNFLKNGEPWNKGKRNVYNQSTLNRIRAPRPKMQGVKKSEETKRRMSEAVRKRYIEKPESFVKPTLNKLAITDGNITKYIEKDQQIPDGFRLGQTHKKKYSIKNMQLYRDQKRKQTSGKNNPMYGHGERISGGKNGKAVYIYTYRGIDYQCRDDLMVTLKGEFPEISESAIRRIMRGSYTKRISNKYQTVIDNLTWRLKKDENKVN